LTIDPTCTNGGKTQIMWHMRTKACTYHFADMHRSLVVLDDYNGQMRWLIPSYQTSFNSVIPWRIEISISFFSVLFGYRFLICLDIHSVDSEQS